jgi:2-phospho-L-lactate guanylyltransferase
MPDPSTREPSRSRPDRVIAAIPVRALEGAKSRLGEVLDAEERRDLVTRLLLETIGAARAALRIDGILVVSPDPATLSVAADAGARPVRQRSGGLDSAIGLARDIAIDEGAGALVVLPGDLPFVSGRAIDALVAAADAHDGPLVVLIPDRHGRGTNALLLRPPDVIEAAFGGDSRAAHRRQALTAGADYEELGGPLDMDLDTADDLLLVDGLAIVSEPLPAGEGAG